MRASTYLVVAALFSPVVGTHPGVAETTPATVAVIPALVPQAPAPKKWTELRVKNITASTLAYWLDPQNNREPITNESSRRSLERLGAAPKAKPSTNYFTLPPPTITLPSYMLEDVPPGPNGEALKLPEGVELVLPADPRNSILAYANDEGLEKLQQLLPYIDRPLRQVEFDCQFLRVPDSLLVQLGLDRRTLLKPPAPDGAPQPPEIQSDVLMKLLRELVAQNQATVVNAPRVLAMNHMAASIVSEVQTPYVVDLSPDKRHRKSGEQAVAYVPTRTGLTILPVIKDQKTISTALWTYVNSIAPENRLPAAGAGPGSAFRLLNLQDGAPTLVAAWDSVKIEPHERGGARRQPGVIIVMATARIVHRYEASTALLQNEPLPAGSWW